MNHSDHVNLIRAGVTYGTWADFGSGAGAFTLALADLLGKDGIIYSIDRDGKALREQQTAMQSRFPVVTVHYHQADFLQRIDLPKLDGILMANSLHFHRDKEAVLRRIKDYLRPGGRLILVEYNVDHGNTWVPHPLSYTTWEKLAQIVGFAHTQLLATQPSRFLKEMYSAVSE